MKGSGVLLKGSVSSVDCAWRKMEFFVFRFFFKCSSTFMLPGKVFLNRFLHLLNEGSYSFKYGCSS